MRDKRLAVVGAQHAAPGKRCVGIAAAHSSRRCRFLVGARYIVPGVTSLATHRPFARNHDPEGTKREPCIAPRDLKIAPNYSTHHAE